MKPKEEARMNLGRFIDEHATHDFQRQYLHDCIEKLEQ